MQESSDDLRAQTAFGEIFSMLETFADDGFMQQVSSDRLEELQQDIAAVPPSTVAFVISRFFDTRPEDKIRLVSLVTAARQAVTAQAEAKSANPVLLAKPVEEQPLGDDVLPQKVGPIFHSKYDLVSVQHCIHKYTHVPCMHIGGTKRGTAISSLLSAQFFYMLMTKDRTVHRPGRIDNAACLALPCHFLLRRPLSIADDQ